MKLFGPINMKPRPTPCICVYCTLAINVDETCEWGPLEYKKQDSDKAIGFGYWHIGCGDHRQGPPITK